MPRLDYKNCRGCGKNVDEVGVLSHTRLCVRCGAELNARAALEQHHHHGEFFQLWRRRIVASAGGVLLDDVNAKP
jgi:hypothetical protein